MNHLVTITLPCRSFRYKDKYINFSVMNIASQIYYNEQNNFNKIIVCLSATRN